MQMPTTTENWDARVFLALRVLRPNAALMHLYDLESLAIHETLTSGVYILNPDLQLQQPRPGNEPIKFELRDHQFAGHGMQSKHKGQTPKAGGDGYPGPTTTCNDYVPTIQDPWHSAEDLCQIAPVHLPLQHMQPSAVAQRKSAPKENLRQTTYIFITRWIYFRWWSTQANWLVVAAAPAPLEPFMCRVTISTYPPLLCGALT
ncbi:hypothetical protein EDB19DRAFT_2023175 [Suillus lakei]|nr:hypothetical protein EDB19DRAFT_2023175 [Suillus lakei]